MSKTIESEIRNFKTGIFSLNTRRFGTLAELMIQILYNFKDSKNLAFDKKNSKNERIEIKFSRVLKENSEKIRIQNVIEEARNANIISRMMKTTDKDSFDCNIQQVKIKEFDILYYGLFFDDIIYIYRIRSDSIKNLPGYSDKQHRGNQGEGQFHINDKNMCEHNKYLDKKVTYDELYDLFS